MRAWKHHYTGILFIFAGLLFAAMAQTPDRAIGLDAKLGAPVLPAGQKQSAYLRVALHGFALEAKDRAPVNIAIVLDRSGSMAGEKLEKAKEAALSVMDRLDERDIVSIVLYDSTVRVLVPATKLSDRPAIREALRGIAPGENTALFAGLAKGAAEVMKFKDPGHVNRILLLSDGLANVGPCTPSELGEYGASLFNDGVSVTTIGLGLDYNEDLMAKLAKSGNGGHLFAQEAADLAQVFDKEFGDVLTAVAQDARVRFECAPGIRPVRVLGRDADIEDNAIAVPFGQLYANQDKYVVIELELPAKPDGATLAVGKASLSCTNLVTKQPEEHTQDVMASFTNDPARVAANEDRGVMVAVVKQIGAEQNELARQLRDEGKIEDARDMLRKNGQYLMDNAAKYESENLKKSAEFNASNLQNMDQDAWTAERKKMREKSLYDQLQGLGYLF